jgi:hypothetical protein
MFMSSWIGRISACLVLVCLAAAPQVASALPGTIPDENTLSNGLWPVMDMGGNTASLRLDIIFQQDGPLYTIPDKVTGKAAERWGFCAGPGDAARLLATNNPSFSPTMVDYNPNNVVNGNLSASTCVKGQDIQTYASTYTYDVSSDAAFRADKASIVKYWNEHRSKRLFQAGLPFFAWDLNDGLTGPDRRVKGPLQLLNADPKDPSKGVFLNGAIDQNALQLGIRDCFLTAAPNFFNKANIGVSNNASSSAPLYSFPNCPTPVGFKVAQIFMFQRIPQNPTGGPPQRYKNGPTRDGWEIPALTVGQTSGWDNVPNGTVANAAADMLDMVTAQNNAGYKMYHVEATGYDKPQSYWTRANLQAAMTNYQPVDLANPDTWTVKYDLTDPRYSNANPPPATNPVRDLLLTFDPRLEANAQAAAQTPLDVYKQSWLQIFSYVDGQIVDTNGNELAHAGPYVFSKVVYVDSEVSYVPATLAAAKGAQTRIEMAPPYQAPLAALGVRKYEPPNVNITFGDIEAGQAFDASVPHRLYRGFPRLEPTGGEQLVGSNNLGQITAEGFNNDSVLCMNLCMSLATRYCYNPDPNAANPPPPPSEGTEYVNWLRTNYPVFISYYPAYVNNKGETIGPYVRLAGTIQPQQPGFPGVGVFQEDPYCANNFIPGQAAGVPKVTMAAMYRPVKFTNGLLKVINYLVLPLGHPNRPNANPQAPENEYGQDVGFVAANGFRYAWRLDFDGAHAAGQGTDSLAAGLPVEVLRIPMPLNNPSFKSEVLPIHPCIPTMEQQTTSSGLVHKATLDSKLLNGPGAGTVGYGAPNTQVPAYGRHNYIYAVVGNCCGPTVLISTTSAQGNPEVPKEGGGGMRQEGARPNSVCVISAVQADSTGQHPEEALGLPNTLDVKTPGGADVGSPAVPNYSVTNITSRAGPDYAFGGYQNCRETVGFDKDPANPNNPAGNPTAPSATNAANPSDSKNKSFLIAQNPYVQGQRYYIDVNADTAVTPQIVQDATAGIVVAYFVKKIQVDIFSPDNLNVPETTLVPYVVKSLAKPPAEPPTARVDFVPRRDGNYIVQTTITDFNDLTRITRMQIPVKPAGSTVTPLDFERRRDQPSN